jgi:hypothetical protein
MSERTRLSLEKLNELANVLAALPNTDDHERLVEETEALKRAVASFHMEAIRFRMHSVERLLRSPGRPAELSHAFNEVRHALETAGFHTRSQPAP